IEGLERLIDFYDKDLKPLKTFILPRGSKAASLIHVGRTICRRAERRIVALSEKEKINQNLIGYVNRLGDLLFVLARYLNKKAKSPELAWSKEK
ncbi:MAG: ATP:cob(I)alamin adenosyltransferase, partial [Candidatus Woykebacteria bacterium RBG_13_40_7b]